MLDQAFFSRLRICWLLGCILPFDLAAVCQVHSDQPFIPRRQDAPPGPPLTPQQALEKMEVPAGFSVQLVAAEPQVVNPVAMCFDNQGRIWVTESFEYPRRQAGPGRDRIKVLEDTNRDGRIDKVTIFAEGLNIPSGIQVGHGGVWVANAPDLLFLQDTTGDLQADTITSVLTGFGRTDTHELPSALTWGPDGYLYGLNGVFNHCHVRYTPRNPNFHSDHPGWQFTCAVWRLDPRTLKFEIFAEGTSNPWGIAIDPHGDFFLSACVIDHLWHVAETGYYIRQGGPYPPHTWPMPSIVKHKHQKAAYCGIVHLDTDAYPPQYSNAFYMGNVHAGCLNVDVVQARGSSYSGQPRADFLTANDVWFMPIAQAIGPDGCLYVLDWYDRYHCYQDANADPEGVDRAHGRIYRIAYRDTPAAEAFNLQTETAQQLLQRLDSGNVYWRQQTQQLLAESKDPEIAIELGRIVDDPTHPEKKRIAALWAYISGRFVQIDRLLPWTRSENPVIAAWAVRAVGNQFSQRQLSENERQAAEDSLLAMTNHPEHHPRVRLQVIVALGKTTLPTATKSNALREILVHSGTDTKLMQIGWNALRPLLMQRPEQAVQPLLQAANEPSIQQLIPRALAVVCDAADQNQRLIAQLAQAAMVSDGTGAVAAEAIRVLAQRTRQGDISIAQQQRLLNDLRAEFDRATVSGSHETALLAAMWGDDAMRARVVGWFQDPQVESHVRLEALRVLIYAKADELSSSLQAVLDDRESGPDFLGRVIDLLGASDRPEIGPQLLAEYARLPADVQPKVIERLTQRSAWAESLLDAINAQQIDRDALNVNQLRQLSKLSGDELRAKLARTYGSIRTAGRTDRQAVIEKVRQQLSNTSGNPFAGQGVFKQVCAQCHEIYGEGAAVGPDITRNGRNDWNQLLNNVFDPSAVIGPAYQARTVLTVDGRVITGIAIEESDQRVALKVQGGAIETIARRDIDDYQVSEVSLMPEGLENQLSEQQLADLLAFLALDRHPADPEAKLLPGAPAQMIQSE